MLQQSIMIGCAHLSYYACHRTEENNISSGTSSDLFLTPRLLTAVYKHAASPARGASTEENTDLSERTEKKNSRKSFSTTDFKCFAFSCYRIKKGTFPYSSLVYIGYAEVPHRDNGWDCKKQEVGSNCCHTTFSGPFSLCLLSYPQFQLRSEGCIMELMSKYYYEGFFSPLTSSDFQLLRYFRLPH